MGKPKWLDPELTEELERDHGSRIAEAIGAYGLSEAAATVEEIKAALAPELGMSSGDEEIIREAQVRSSLDVILERTRVAAVTAPVREQFEDDLRALTEAEQDSKQLKSAKASAFDRIVETVELPFPVGLATVDGGPS